MRAGPLRHKVILQEKSVTGRDAKGGEVIDWVEFSTVRANVVPLRGREYVAIRQAQAELQVRIEMRFLSGVTSAMRAVHGTAIYNIADVIDVGGRRRNLELMCTAEAPPT